MDLFTGPNGQDRTEILLVVAETSETWVWQMVEGDRTEYLETEPWDMLGLVQKVHDLREALDEGGLV
jgi:hypothetical protein